MAMMPSGRSRGPARGCGIFGAEKIPLLVGGAIQKRARVAGIGEDQAAGGREKRADDRGGERARARQRGKLLIQLAHEFGLVEAIDEAAHQRAQVGGRGGDGGAVAGNVGEQEARDAAGGATRGVVDVAAALRLLVRLAVDPGVEAAKLDGARGELAAAPHFHALHVLRRWLAGSRGNYTGIADRSSPARAARAPPGKRDATEGEARACDSCESQARPRVRRN